MSKQTDLINIPDTITVSGSNVGINDTAPSSLLQLTQTSDNASGGLQIRNTADSNSIYIYQDGNVTTYDAGSSGEQAFKTGNSERMRINSSGDLLVAQTSTGDPGGANIVGAGIGTVGYISTSRNNAAAAYFNRKSTDGDLAVFRKNGSTVGTIGTGYGGSNQFGIQSHTPDLRFKASNSVVTWDGTQFYPAVSGSRKLGHPNHRWEDAWIVNGVTTGSDANDKQDIATLTATEMLVAARLSQTFRTYRWKDKVVEKGDNARTHTGTIAQEVQDAFTAEGLDAGDYAMFMSDTRWEHDVDVPAVEAVAEVTDEDGNITTEAVEAVDAYTRTDTYDTEAEAPEGATSKTRLGIRYPELLSFVAAYNEQRFASIEARLTALEA